MKKDIVDKAFDLGEDPAFQKDFDRKYEYLYSSGADTLIRSLKEAKKDWEKSKDIRPAHETLLAVISSAMMLGYGLRVAEELDEKTKN